MTSLDYSYKAILKFATPILFGAFVQSLILFADSAFISAYNTLAFAALGNAGLIYISFFMIGNGLADAGQIYIARMFGRNDLKEVKIGFQSNLINLITCSVGIFILIEVFNSHVLPGIFKSSDIAAFSFDYLRIRSVGFIFSFFTLAITSLYVAIGKSRILLYNVLILCCINVGLDYILIFGHFGMPVLGIKGAAYATVIAEIVVCVFSIAYLMYNDIDPVSKGLFRNLKWNKTQAITILKLALPLMIQGFVAVGAWTVFFFMIEQMGEFELEVSQIIHKAYFIAIIPMIGFSSAMRTYVSNLMATHAFDEIKQVIKKIHVITYLFLAALIHGFVFYPEMWISIIDVEASDAVIDETKTILFLITGSILIHGSAVLFQSAIAGAGNTRAAMYIEIGSITIYLTCVYLFIFVIKVPIWKVWLAEYIYFSTFLILSILYFYSGRWKTEKI